MESDGGDFYYEIPNLNVNWRRDTNFPMLYKHSVKGEFHNSIALCGAFGLLSYFNGARWYSIENTEQQKYLGIDIRGDIIVAVGQEGAQAVITIGKR